MVDFTPIPARPAGLKPVTGPDAQAMIVTVVAAGEVKERSRPPMPEGARAAYSLARVRQVDLDAAILAALRRHPLTNERAILTGSGAHAAVYARWEVMWRLRQIEFRPGVPKYSYAAIGAALGGLDRTTVRHGIREHEKRMRGAR